jgi:CelD/BcsL family acetyltransferase involved in cellulose biosynthesis
MADGCVTSRVVLVDPLADPRWDDLLLRHPRASVFHTSGWLAALRRTYGYEPLAVTTTAEGPLANGLVACRVRTAVSRRLVSLPFSDHCDPLAEAGEDLAALVGVLAGEVQAGRSRSLELRPRQGAIPGLGRGASYHLHCLDLSRSEAEIFNGFHASSTRRAIRRAEREQLTWEWGTSERLLGQFYNLFRMTRRRHNAPPQPLAWFRNLTQCVGGAAIHVASKGGRPVASILTLSFKKSLVYKYGGSDAEFHRLGAMPFLFWRAIQQGKAAGIEELDLGRSDLDQPGLVTFKEHLGAVGSPLTYYRWPEARAGRRPARLLSKAGRIFAYLPEPAFTLAGRLLYRHLG